MPSWRVRERLDLAAVSEGGDGYFLDEIGDGQRFGGPVGAAVASAAERAAPSAGVSGNKAACGDQQQLDSVLAGRGEAGVQAGHRPPVRRFPEELGCDALVLQVRQSWMTRLARSRTFAGVRVCGSATKLPAN